MVVFAEVSGDGNIFASTGVVFFYIRPGVVHSGIECGSGFTNVLFLASFACD